jgi:hypothetical protein
MTTLRPAGTQVATGAASTHATGGTAAETSAPVRPGRNRPVPVMGTADPGTSTSILGGPDTGTVPPVMGGPDPR